MEKLRVLGMLIGITAMALAWYFFSWKLVLVLMLAQWGSNIEMGCKKNKP